MMLFEVLQLYWKGKGILKYWMEVLILIKNISDYFDLECELLNFIFCQEIKPTIF